MVTLVIEDLRFCREVLSKWIFKSLSSFYPGPRTREFVVTSLCVSWTVWIFFLTLVSSTLLGIDWRGGLSSRMCLVVSIMGIICPLVGFLVLQGVSSNTLAFRQHLDDSAPFLGYPLWSYLSDVSEECPKSSANLITFSALFVLSVPSDLLGGILSCLRYNDHLITCLTKFLQDCATGDSKLLEVMLRDCKKFSGKSYPYLLFSTFRDGEGIDGMYSLLSDGIFFCLFINSIG